MMKPEFTTKEERERARTWRGWDSLAPAFREYLARLDAHLEAALAALEQEHQALVPNKQLPHNLCAICDIIAAARGGAA